MIKIENVDVAHGEDSPIKMMRLNDSGLTTDRPPKHSGDVLVLISYYRYGECHVVYSIGSYKDKKWYIKTVVLNSCKYKVLGWAELPEIFVEVDDEHGRKTMTEERAIELLEHEKQCFIDEGYTDNGELEAYDIAIEALSRKSNVGRTEQERYSCE